MMQVGVVDSLVIYILDQEEKREQQKRLKLILCYQYAGDLLDGEVKEDLKDPERHRALELILLVDQLFKYNINCNKYRIDLHCKLLIINLFIYY
jgi:hypothetical protein